LYQALYRKWRPQTFEQVVGQSHITNTLKNQVMTDRVSHAYIFTGTRGTGKTTCAKILARAVNCEHPADGSPCNECPSCRTILNGETMDVVELDAASNTGVDNIRDILDETIYPPANVRRRVYIIDEVHMLSAGAFNALLKTLEEPPEHVLFILATTELHKVAATILSRCQRFDFKRVEPKVIAANISHIAQSEQIPITGGAIGLLAKLADGSIRDSLSLLERCLVNAGDLDEAAVSDCLGLSREDDCAALADAVASRDAAAALDVLDRLYRDGRDMRSVLTAFSAYMRDVLICITAPKSAPALADPSHTMKALTASAQQFTAQRAMTVITALRGAVDGLQRNTANRLETELCFIELCTEPGTPAAASAAVPAVQTTPAAPAPVPAALLARLDALEQALANGAAAAAPAPASKPTAPKAPPPKPTASEDAASEPGADIPKIPEQQFNRILDRLKGRVSNSVRINLQMSHLSYQNGVLTVWTEDAVATRLIDKPDARAIIADAAAEELGPIMRMSVKMQDASDDFSGFDSIITGAADAGIPIKTN